MNCNFCYAEIKEDDAYCSKCGERVTGDSKVVGGVARDNNIQVGSGSRNRVNVGKIEQFNIQQNFNNNLSQHATYEDKVLFTLMNNKKFTFTGFVVSLLSFLGSIASIYGLYLSGFNLGSLPSLNRILSISTILLPTGMFVLIIGRDLNKQKFFRLPLYGGRGINLKNINDIIKVVKVFGTCPICKGKINLVTDENRRTIGVCENNWDHRYSFDHTTYRGQRI